MMYLRAREYGPSDGRFLTRDTSGGDDNKLMSYRAPKFYEQKHALLDYSESAEFIFKQKKHIEDTIND